MDDLEGDTGILKPRTKLANENKEEAYVRPVIAHLATTDGLCGMSNRRTQYRNQIQLVELSRHYKHGLRFVEPSLAAITPFEPIEFRPDMAVFHSSRRVKNQSVTS